MFINVYLFFLCFLNLSFFIFIIKFKKQEIAKLTIAPILARRTVLNISSVLMSPKEESKVPLAVPIHTGAFLRTMSLFFMLIYIIIHCCLAYGCSDCSCYHYISGES